MLQNNMAENAPALYNEAAAIPAWIIGKGRINEYIFCKEFISQYPLAYFDDRFYTMDGEITDDKVKFLISLMISS